MKLYIEDMTASGNKSICTNASIYVLEDDGRKVDISNMVRSCDVRLHYGEAITANLDVFVTGFKGLAETEEVILRRIPKKRWWQRAGKWRKTDISVFGRNDGARRFV